MVNATKGALIGTMIGDALGAPFEAKRLFRERLAHANDLLQRSVTTEEIVAALGHAPLAIESVPAALVSFAMHTSSFEEAVKYSLALGGDTDTIGAMTGALAGAFHGLSEIPGRWVDRLENGPKGRDYVLGLAEKLLGQRCPGSPSGRKKAGCK